MARPWSRPTTIMFLVIGVIGWWANLLIVRPETRWAIAAASTVMTLLAAVLIWLQLRAR